MFTVEGVRRTDKGDIQPSRLLFQHFPGVGIEMAGGNLFGSRLSLENIAFDGAAADIANGGHLHNRFFLEI